MALPELFNKTNNVEHAEQNATDFDLENEELYQDMSESTSHVGDSMEKGSLSGFVYCQHFQGNDNASSTPAHWHEEVEVLHVMQGDEYLHISQGKVQKFSAPAILIIPSNIIHRTYYPANSSVSRILFKAEDLRLSEDDVALNTSLRMLCEGGMRHSLVIEAKDVAYYQILEALELLEQATDIFPKSSFTPIYSDITPNERDKMEAFVSANFVNIANRSKDKSGKLIDGKLKIVTSRRRGYKGLTIAAERERVNSSMNHIVEIKKEYVTPNSDQMLKFHKPILGVNLQLKAYLMLFVGLLYEYGYMSIVNIGRRPRTGRTSEAKIKELLTTIHDNYNQPLNISVLAAQLEVTNQYFCRLFKQLTYTSFIDYLNNMRLQKAAYDIIHTNNSIREISMRHGFETIGYFFKLFRETYNTTPSKFRKNICEDAEDEDIEEEKVEILPKNPNDPMPEYVNNIASDLAAAIEPVKGKTRADVVNPPNANTVEPKASS